MTSPVRSQESIRHIKQLFQLFVCGIGSRLDGTGAVVAWVNQDSRKKRVRIMPDLSKPEAEYLAVLSAVESVPQDAQVEIGCSSPLLCCQFDERCVARGHKIVRLLARIRTIIHARRLEVGLWCLPRALNPAAKLAHRHRRRLFQNSRGRH
jgi:hypothetical protein